MAPRVMDLTKHKTPELPDSPPTATLHKPQLSPKDVELPPSPPFESTEAEHNNKASAPTLSPLNASPRPLATRRVTSPESTPILGIMPTYSPARSPRTQSPSRNGPRSSYSSTAISLPLMQRAHSSPGVDSTGRFVAPGRPSSPLGQYGRRRSPLRSAVEESYIGTPSWSGLNIEPNIPEHEALEIPAAYLPLARVSESDESSQSALYSLHNTFPRSRRRPHSPLHQSASAPSLYARATSPGMASGGSSPSILAQKYANEPYPLYSLGSASSMPSTPTSFRSRSPSVSSLETIEDSPDAEEAARIEAEEMAKLKAEEGEAGGDLRRRSSLELRRELRSNKERKRWSVCGAERRADFSLEPIEE